MKKKIYITGCAKSGTTLVRRLFNAFEELNVYNKKEITPADFINSEYDVGKRSYISLFSGKMNKQSIQQHTKIYQNLIVIDVLRNKKDVLKSDNGYVTADRYDACIEQRKQYGTLIHYTIIYEKLIENPNQIQKKYLSY